MMHSVHAEELFRFEKGGCISAFSSSENFLGIGFVTR